MPQINGGFLLRGPAGQYYGISWAALGDPQTAQGRFQLVRYDSPAIAGFILSASIMEDGSTGAPCCDMPMSGTASALQQASAMSITRS
jgi:hypothetical protein